MSVQRTLDGDEARERDTGGGLKTGSAVILDKADPDTDLDRLAHWIERARAEGVLYGVDR